MEERLVKQWLNLGGPCMCPSLQTSIFKILKSRRTVAGETRSV